VSTSPYVHGSVVVNVVRSISLSLVWFLFGLPAASGR
jgi:hypothetical protein